MIGPRGYGAAGFVSRRQILEYTIRFENDANATAPAQNVIIKHQLDKDLDISTFRLGSFGFGDYVKNIPDRKLTWFQVGLSITALISLPGHMCMSLVLLIP